MKRINGFGRLQNNVFVVMMLAICLVGLAACGNSGAGGSASQSATKASSSNAKSSAGGTDATSIAKKVTLTFWNGFTGPDGDFLKQLVDEYNKNNTANVEVKMDIMPWDQLGQKLPAAIATQTAPSFAALIAGTSTSYIKNGTLQDISDYFSVSGAAQSDLTDVSLQLGQRGSKQYLLPMQVNGLYLYWNKDLFKAAGLDPNTPPSTMDELAQDAKKLTDAGKDQYGFGIPVSGAPPFFASFIRGNGGDVVDMQAKKSVFDSPENVATYQWIQNLVVNEKASPVNATGADLEKLMQSGKLGMYIDGPWLAPGLKGSNIHFGVGLPPKGKAAQFTVFDGIGFAVPSTTPADEKKAIYDFIKYWESPAVVKQWSLKNGFPPYVKSLLNDKDIQADPVVSGMSNMGDAAHTFLSGLSSADKITNDILFTSIAAVENGQSASDVVTKASKQIDDALNQMDK